MQSGFVAVVGRPNVGKSTLVNALVGEKIAITAAQPQTTRNTVRGVLTFEEPEAQAVFIDTPGLHRPRTALGERLNKLVYSSLAEADGVIFVLDALQRVGPGDRRIAQRLIDADTPVIVVVNKVDAGSGEEVVEQLAEAGEWDFAAYIPASAKEGEGLGLITAEVLRFLPEGPFFFPPGMRTDQPDEFLAAELIREKYLMRLQQELPHSLAVVIEELVEREDGMLYLAGSIYVERNSQKGIVIGSGGALLRVVGSEARVDLERHFGTSIYLDLRVRVERDWQRRKGSLDRLGY